MGGSLWCHPQDGTAPPCCVPKALSPHHSTGNRYWRCCRGLPSGSPPSCLCGGSPLDRTDQGRSLLDPCRLSKQRMRHCRGWPEQKQVEMCCSQLTGSVPATQGASAMPRPLVVTFRVPARACLVYSVCLIHISFSNSIYTPDHVMFNEVDEVFTTFTCICWYKDPFKSLLTLMLFS